MKYISVFSNKEISAHQFITEIFLRKIYENRGVSLSNKFWNIPEYRKIYKNQILAAASILKVYRADQVIEAIARNDLKGIYSLRSYKMDKLIKDVVIHDVEIVENSGKISNFNNEDNIRSKL